MSDYINVDRGNVVAKTQTVPDYINVDLSDLVANAPLLLALAARGRRRAFWMWPRLGIQRCRHKNAEGNAGPVAMPVTSVSSQPP